MARKISSSFINNAAQLVRSGLTVKQAAQAIGCNPDVLSQKLRALGIDTSVGKRQGAASLRRTLPEQEIISLYAEGLGAPALAKRYGCSTATITGILARNDIPKRDGADANRIVALRKTREQHVAGIQNARETRARNMVYAATAGIPTPAVTSAEIVLGDIFSWHGFNPSRQVIIDGYLVDITIDKIAVEVKTRANIASTELETARSKKILERGYSFVFVSTTDTGSLHRHAQDLITLFHRLCANPPTGREYWVIRCALYDVGTDFEQDQWSVVRCSPKGSTSVPQVDNC